MEQHTALTGSPEEVAELLRAAERIAASAHSEHERAPEILETSISASAVGQAAIEVARIPRHKLDEEKVKYVKQVGRLMASYRTEALRAQAAKENPSRGSVVGSSAPHVQKDFKEAA